MGAAYSIALIAVVLVVVAASAVLIGAVVISAKINKLGSSIEDS